MNKAWLLLLILFIATVNAAGMQKANELNTKINPAAENTIINDGIILPYTFEKIYPEIQEDYSKDYLMFDYDRFTLYVEPGFYSDNETEINEFMQKFEPRLNALEEFTEWKAEETDRGEKLIISMRETTGCYGGGGANGIVYLYFSNPMYMQGCQRAYFENGSPHFNNPGELGDWWGYMEIALHETTHGITPNPIIYRLWLAEGFGRYNEYNILSNYNGNGFADITQETADHYLFAGDSAYNWELYTTNDYHDGLNNEIQESAGYDISAWMLVRMKNEHNLNWQNFFDLMQNNKETLNYSESLGNYFTDSYLIDLLGKASGMDYETQTKPLFRYDSPTGPGWGIRNWENLNWYTDLTPELSFSEENPIEGENIQLNAVIFNNGNIGLDNVSVRFYNGSELLNEQFVSVPALDKITVSTGFSGQGSYEITVKVDEENKKIELNELNNEDTKEIIFNSQACGNINGIEGIDIDDIIYLANYVFKGGPEPVSLESADVDLSGNIDLDDIMFLVDYVFNGGPAPCQN